MTQTRMTKQRAVILEVLRNTLTHPTADEIYGMVRLKMPRISLGTIYRNLDLLVGSGEVRCLNQVGSQKRFDGNMSAHHHVRCTFCGKVGDVFLSVSLPQVDREAVPGFSITGVEEAFVGVCHECMRNMRKTA